MKSFLDYACQRYYEGSPILTDYEFDRLAEAHSYTYLGYTSSGNRVPHMYPMYSLQKVYPEDSVPEYPEGTPIITTTKLDGAAVSVLYVDGYLKLALTRGDGKKGIDITDKMSYLVETELRNTLGEVDPVTIQITGEVVAPKSLKNARNYAAGALGLNSIEEFKTRDLKFIAYEVMPAIRPTWHSAMNALQMYSIDTVLRSDWQQYPNDGLVVRVTSYDTFEKMGYTSHHPRGAYALKTRKVGEITTLLDVIWQVGRSGVVSPVAVLDPIEIDGAMVSRATLHNMRYIESLGLEIGCEVEVIRAGEIIPRIVARVG